MLNQTQGHATGRSSTAMLATVANAIANEIQEESDSGRSMRDIARAKGKILIDYRDVDDEWQRGSLPVSFPAFDRCRSRGINGKRTGRSILPLQPCLANAINVHCAASRAAHQGQDRWIDFFFRGTLGNEVSSLTGFFFLFFNCCIL